ncbi:unnamed protein product [Orchesella dallaii]|uniref:Uncharacterized protein n=1 Tax=Orchesella dallaii TaxID=48710 RepID=A0ABP1QXH0_9HEXA
MKLTVASAIFFAASIAVAVAYPSRRYYEPVSYDDGEYPGGRSLWEGQPQYTLASAPFFYQPRNLDLEDAASRARKYKIVKKKKDQGAPGSGSDEEEDEEPQDDDDESSEEEEDEEEDEEQSLDVPPWEKLFPEEDKNTGTFDDQGGASPDYGQGGQGPSGYGQGGQGPSGYGQGGGQGPSGYPEGQGSGGYGGSLANIPGGAPAPQGSSGGLMSLFTGGSSSSSSSGNGPQSDLGGPPQYREGRPPQYRGRTSLQDVEEPRSGGAVLYDGYRYIPVKPVHVQLGERQAKKIKANKQKQEKTQARSLRTSATSSQQNKKLSTNSNKKIVLVPVRPRDSREIRFSRDEDGVESGPIYAPTEIWRWEGPGGRPLRRRENRPSGLYYAPRPQRGSSSSVRFAEENDY